MKKSKTSQAERKRRQEKIKEAIAMVNDTLKVKLAPSDIHGIGVFAIKDIKRGERIYAATLPFMLDIPYKDFNKLDKEAREVILERFPMVAVEDSQFFVPDTLAVLYMNHSEKPNYDNKKDKALKNIKAGEEITENYKTIKDWQKVYKWLTT